MSVGKNRRKGRVKKRGYRGSTKGREKEKENGIVRKSEGKEGKRKRGYGEK